MADDVTLPGTGTIIKTIEKTGAEHVQLVALDMGPTTTSSPVVAGQAAMAASFPVVIASNQSALDVTVNAPDIVVTMTPTLDTSAYAAGDLLFNSTTIPNAVRANGGTAILQSMTLLDKGDQGAAMTLIFANAATDFGTFNSAPNPDDAESETVIGVVRVAEADYIDLGSNRVATLGNLGLLLKAGAATTSLYVAGVNSTGTPTYSASDLVFQFGFLRS
jgi:hypothetical protein